MAWLQNLAGKAENLLNKIDQNAATVLNESGNPKNLNKDSDLVDDDDNNSKQFSHTYSDGKSSVFEESRPSISSPQYFQTEEEPKTNHPSLENQEISVFTEVIDEKSLESNSVSSRASSVQNLSFDSPPVNYSERINRLEAENSDLNKQILNLQHLYSQIQNANASLQSQVETANNLAFTARSEMEQYKVRSQRILQEKEKLISLKREAKHDNNEIINNYNEDLKKELEFEQTRNVELSRKLGTLTKEIGLLQHQIIVTQNSSQESTEILKKSLETEEKLRSMAEEECRSKNQGLHEKVQELTQQYNVIRQQNAEIDHLKNVLKSSASHKPDEDVESRMKMLTDTLMLKQNSLETVTSERNALRIQLEKLQNEHRESLLKLQRSQVSVINVNDTDDAKSQVPQFLRVSPLDAGVTRRVKHAYSTVDAISIRTGVFLRRYPVARVCVFSYMVLLHIWALIILFIYAPNNR